MQGNVQYEVVERVVQLQNLYSIRLATFRRKKTEGK